MTQRSRWRGRFPSLPGYGQEEEDGEDVEGNVGYSRETLEATVFLLCRLQAVMTRAWDRAELSPAAVAAAATSTGSDNDGGANTSSSVLSRASGSLVGENGSTGGIADNDDEDDGDALADTFVGSTRRARKWDWVRCCHEPVNPALAIAGRGTPAGGGSTAQPVVAPVAIDAAFCHRTLRPGKPGPEGCTLEQVQFSSRARGDTNRVIGPCLRVDCWQCRVCVPYCLRQSCQLKKKKCATNLTCVVLRSILHATHRVPLAGGG